MFSPEDIERIGVKNECLLEHVNDYMQTGYNRIIEVIITDTISKSYATKIERVYETPEYALDASGHEIAHIVSFQEWGYTSQSFFQEGIAVSASINPDAKNSLVDFKNFLRIKLKKNMVTIEEVMYEMKRDITEDAFNKTGFEYNRTGAFFHYLKINFGMILVKNWYLSTINSDADCNEATFLSIFKRPLDDVINDFSNELTSSINQPHS